MSATDNRTTELRHCKYCGEKPQVLKIDGRAAHACRVLDRELRMTVDEWNAENEDATEVLRRMLNERGVKWYEGVSFGAKAITRFKSNGVWFRYVDYDDYQWLDYDEDIPLTPERAIAATLGGEINGDTSDGYHTFNELYHHRAVLFSVVVANHRGIAWKSKLHHDGTMYDGMFIVGLDTPWGQASYHYDIDPYWDMFDCEERVSAPEWDGHTPDDAIERIGKLAALGGGKLTAEQVRGFLERHSTLGYATWLHGTAELVFDEDELQAMADELNTKLDGGECEWVWVESWTDTTDGRECDYAHWMPDCGCWSEYDHRFSDFDDYAEKPIGIAFCERCGKAVKR